MEELKAAPTGSEEDEAVKQRILEEYEKSMEHTYKVPEHGIDAVNKECAYPVRVGGIKSGYCPEDGDFQSYTPKHVDTPEEVMQKYYAGVLQSHKDVCESGGFLCADCLVGSFVDCFYL